MALTTEQLNKYIQENGINNKKLAMKNLLDVYYDNWEGIILDELALQFKKSNKDKLRPLITKELNLIKKVTNSLALVYKNAAARVAVIGEAIKAEDIKVDEAYEEIIKDTDIDMTMKAVNKMVELTNQCLLKVNWRNERIEFDILTFDNAEIATDPEDWKKIVCIKYYVDLVLPEDQSRSYGESIYKANPTYAADGTTSFGVPIDDAAKTQYSTMFLWTLEDRDENGNYEEARLRKYYYQNTDPYFDEEVTFKDKNGFAVLPFVFFPKTTPIRSLVDYTTGNDLWDGNLNTAINMIHLNQLIKYQSYKLIAITTSSPTAFQGDLSLDPQTILKLYDPDGNTDVEVLDTQTSILDIWQVIRERIITIFASSNIPPNAMRLSGSPESGYKVHLDKQGLIEMREDDIQIYRTKEKELFNIIRIVNNVHNKLKINEEAVFKIDFAEITPPESPEDKAKADTVQIMNNTKTPIDFIMRDNPDLTRDEATIVFNNNKAINSGALPPGAALTEVEQPITTDEEEEEEEAEDET